MEKGIYTIDCPNESDCVVCGENGHYMDECPTKSACKETHRVKYAGLVFDDNAMTEQVLKR